MAHTRMQLKHKIVLITLLILGGVMLVVGAVITPSIRYITGIRHQIETTEAQLEEQYQKIRLLKKSINELERIKKDTQNFEYITVKKGQELRVIRELEQTALANNIKQDLGVEYTEKGQGVKQGYYTFTFKCQGSYQNLMGHLYALEQLPYYVIIDKIDLAKQTNNRGQAIDTSDIVMNFSAKIYSSQ